MSGSALTANGLAFIYTMLRLATPLAYGAFGGYCSERSGTINIALEGMMLLGSFCAAAVAYQTHSPALGVAAGIGGAMFGAALHGLLCLRFRADQIISGIAVNLLAAGVAPVFCKAFYNASSGTPLLQLADRVPQWGQLSPLVFGSALCFVGLWAVHAHTRLGQYLRFAGENPEAMRSQGLDVIATRWKGILLSGFFCGLGGAYLSIDHGGGFTRNMTAGRGFIALAALIVGRWHPAGAFLAALGFGAIEATQILLQGVTLPGGGAMPVQWIQIIPYLATLAILAGAIGGKWTRSRPPKMLGIPA